LPNEGQRFFIAGGDHRLTILVLSVSYSDVFYVEFVEDDRVEAAAKKVSGILRYYRRRSDQQGSVYQVLFDLIEGSEGPSIP